MSHTVGEWTLNKKNGRIVECDGRKIITAASTPWDSSEAWANAKLIAAAPELLKALQDLYSKMDSCIELTPEVMLAARAAICKANGIKP